MARNLVGFTGLTISFVNFVKSICALKKERETKLSGGQVRVSDEFFVEPMKCRTTLMNLMNSLHTTTLRETMTDRGPYQWSILTTNIFKFQYPSLDN
jgi:hypothetical protein